MCHTVSHPAGYSAGYFVHGSQKCNQEGNDRQNPSDGPDKIQECEIREKREYQVYPHKPDRAHEDQCCNRGNDGLAQAFQRTSHKLIDAAYKVCTGDQHHFLLGEADHFR